MKHALIGSMTALLAVQAAAQTMDFDTGFGLPLPGMTAASPLPPLLTNGLGATRLGGAVPGIGSIGGVGTGIGLGGSGLGVSTTPTVGIGSLQPGGLRADLFGRLPNITGSGMMIGSTAGSTGLLDFLATPALEDPFLTNPPRLTSPTLGGSSPGLTTAGGGIFEDPFCRPEDFTC